MTKNLTSHRGKTPLVLAIVLFSAVFFAVFMAREQEPENQRPVVTQSKQVENKPAQSPQQVAPQVPPRAVASSGLKRINDQQRQKLIADIMRKISQAAAVPVPGKAGAEIKKEQQEQDVNQPVRGHLDAAYIKQQMVEILPLVKECYENALAVSEDKSINGRVVVKFTIIGDPELGGVITKSALSEKDQSMPKDFQQCIRETMYALQLKAPANGGQISVSYPFTFRSSEK